MGRNSTHFYKPTPILVPKSGLCCEPASRAETDSFCESLQQGRHDLFVGFLQIFKHKQLPWAAIYLFSKTSDADPLTNTDSLRHSRVYGAPLLFRPTRKRPRQATPPSRHREQQQGEEDEADDDREKSARFGAARAESNAAERCRREPKGGGTKGATEVAETGPRGVPDLAAHGQKTLHNS